MMDKFSHGIHGVGMIKARPGKAVTLHFARFVFEYFGIGLIRLEIGILKVIVIVVGSQKSVESFHFIEYWHCHVVQFDEPDGILVHLVVDFVLLLPLLTGLAVFDVLSKKFKASQVR